MKTTLAAGSSRRLMMNVPERLARGEEYFYFVGGETDRWLSTMVTVCSIREHTVDQWIAEYSALKSEMH